MLNPFEIHYPHKCFTDKITQTTNVYTESEYADLSLFYDNLMDVMGKLHIPYEMVNTMLTDYDIPNVDPKKNYLGYQIHDNMNPNVWCIKTSYLTGYIYFDPTGYTHWSHITNDKILFDKSQSINFNIAERFLMEYARDWKSGNISRISQPKLEKPKFDFPYFLYAYQNWYDNDIALKFADHLKMVAPDHKLVLKYHPKLKNENYLIPPHDNIVIVKNSIHDLLPDCMGVLSTSSGVGIEAMFYDKHVFTFGPHDYHWVVNNMKLETIPDILTIANMPFPKESTYKFLYYLMNNYWIDVNDVFRIQNRLFQMTNYDLNF
jgi:hypothetical protein